MATEVILPRVDMDMESGKITNWFVAEGEPVVKGKPLFEIETDKAAMEVEAPVDGILRGVSKAIGEMLPVGAVVGWIYALDEPYDEKAAQSASKGAATITFEEPKSSAASEPAQSTEVAAPGVGVRATPRARQLAREQGIDLSAVAGGGPRGRVQAKDLPATTPAKPATIASPPARDLHREWLARGAGAPVVLIHGFGADLNGWRPLHGYLSSGRGHLALDLPGHGQSALSGATTLEAFVEAIEATLEDEGVQSAHFVGHSLGGAVAAAYAAYLPAHVRSLTLIAPAGLGPEFNGAFTRGFLGAKSEASLAPWIRELAVDEGALGSAMVKATLMRRAERPLVEAQTAVAASLFPDGVQAVSVRSAFARYAGPTRVVFGLEDRIIPATQARGLPGRSACICSRMSATCRISKSAQEIARIVEDNLAAGDRRSA